MLPRQAGVEAGVQQRRVDTESCRPGGLALRQAHLGEDVLSAPPGRPQPPEHRPVPVSGRGQAVVEAVQRHGLGVRRRPLGQVEGLSRTRLGGSLLGEYAIGVPDPLVARGVHALRVDAHRSPAVLPLRSDADLDPDATVLRNDERGLEGEFFQAWAAGLVPGPDGELREARAGQQHRPGHRVIVQPGVRTQGDPAGQHHALVVCQPYGRAEYGVFRRGKSQGVRVAHGRTRVRQPVPLPLEGVRRQLHLASAGQQGGPVHVDPAREHFGHRRQQSVQPALLTPQRSGRHRLDAGVLGGGLCARHQYRMGTALHEEAVAVLQHGAHRALVVHRLTGIVEPVVGAQLRGVQHPAGHGRVERHL